jgi:type VII secretion-associated serine protease mycosin
VIPGRPRRRPPRPGTALPATVGPAAVVPAAVVVSAIVLAVTAAALAFATPVAAAAATVSSHSSQRPARNGDQWHITTLRIRQAHLITRGAGVAVAVVDGGVDASHPELAGQVVPGAGFGSDAARDGGRDDDEGGHGTAMAGIIAARDDGPADAVVGIAPAAKILPASTGAEADTAEVARAVRWAADHGADVVNLSLGSPGPAFRMEAQAIEYALQRDVVIVASAGNAAPGDLEINSPANIPGVVAVTGSTQQGGFWSGSVTGPEAAIAAPAPGIRSPVPTRVSADGLDTGAGTSNSAAVVSGVAALIRARFPDLDAANVVNRLIRTAVDAGPPGRDDHFGFGVVDPVAALTADVAPVRANPLLAPPSSGSAAGADPRAHALNEVFAEIGGGGDRPDGGDGRTGGAGGDPGAGAAGGPDSTAVGDWLIGLAIAVPVGAAGGVLAHRLSTRSRRPGGQAPGGQAPGGVAAGGVASGGSAAGGAWPGCAWPGNIEPGAVGRAWQGEDTLPAAPPAAPPPPGDAFAPSVRSGHHTGAIRRR